MAFGITSSFGRSFKVGDRPLTITSAAQLPNLEVWYFADVNTNVGGVSSGTAVSAWSNAGGLSSHDLNSIGGTRPEWYSNLQNGKGAVRFNGTTLGVPLGEDIDNDERLSINPVSYLHSLSGSTMAIVFKTLSTSAGVRYCSSTDTNGFQWGQNGTQWIGGHAGATYSLDSTVADTNYHHIVLRFDGSATGNSNRFKARLDGADSALTFSGTVGTTTSPTAGYFFTGCTGTNTTTVSNFWQGDIGELLIWTRALNTGEILAVEEYLTSKWAI